MGSDNTIVRELIYKYLHNKNDYSESEFLHKVKELEYDLPERILLNIFYYQYGNKKIELKKIRNLIQNYLLEKLQQSKDHNDFKSSINGLVDIFLPNCRYNKEQIEESIYVNPLCEGNDAGKFYLVHSYFIDKEIKCSECQNKLKYRIGNVNEERIKVECSHCNTKIENMNYFCPDCNNKLYVSRSYLANYSNLQLKCSQCERNEEKKESKIDFDILIESKYSRPYKNLDEINCPICKNEKIEKNENVIVCDNCLLELQIQYKNIYYCQGKICGDPNRKRKEFFEPAKLKIQNIVINREIVMLSSWLNKFLKILHNAYCNECKNPLAPKINLNKRELVRYKATRFECVNNKCKEYGKLVYLNNCSNRYCSSLIDSRITKEKCNNGFYICKDCYSCCNNYHFARDGRSTKGHLEQNLMYCPDCGCRLIISKYTHDILYCAKCKQEKEIVYAHRYYSEWEDLQKIRANKFKERLVSIKKRKPIIKN